MPQFDMSSLNDVGGAISRAEGINASRRGANKGGAVPPGAASMQGGDAEAGPDKLAYWLLKTKGRKNAAYTMWKRHRRGAHPGGSL